MQRLVEFTSTGTTVLLILGRAASSFFITFLSSFVGPSDIRLSRRMADGSSPLSSCQSARSRCSFLVLPVTSDSKVKGEERCRTACGGFFHSKKKRVVLTEVASLRGVYHIMSNYIKVCLVDSFDPHFSMIHT